jgi:hypothetical protein
VLPRLPTRVCCRAAYDGATGSKLWVRRYDGPAHGNDTGHGLHSRRGEDRRIDILADLVRLAQLDLAELEDE